LLLVMVYKNAFLLSILPNSLIVIIIFIPKCINRTCDNYKSKKCVYNQKLLYTQTICIWSKTTTK